MTARQHIEAFNKYAPGVDLDYVVVNNHPISDEQMQKYTGEGADQIGVHGSVSPETIANAEIVYGNLLDEGEMVRHHPEKLAQVLLLCALQPREKAVAG